MSVTRIPDANFDRILRLSMKEAAAGIEALVQSAFEGLPLDADELPVIGSLWPFVDCTRVEQKKLAVAALLAAKWFETEAPPWACPLLLTSEACIAVQQGCHWRDNHRALLRGRYGMHARSVEWDPARMKPFEIFCANELSPSRSVL